MGLTNEGNEVRTCLMGSLDKNLRRPCEWLLSLPRPNPEENFYAVFLHVTYLLYLSATACVSLFPVAQINLNQSFDGTDAFIIFFFHLHRQI